MKLLNVEKTPATSEKRFVATFCKCNGPSKCLPKDRPKIVFGSKNGHTFIDGADEKTKQNYLARHSVNEDWSKINPGSLSRYILWSKKSLSAGIAEFKKRFSC
jgi:hypothetical protein